MKVTVDLLTGMPQIVNQETKVYSSSGVINQSGGSSSSPLTTKGDVYTHSTVDARLGVGADGTVLTADSSQATGLKWNAASGTGTVTSVTSANSDATVANTTTTPAITIVSAPKLTTARTIGTTTGDATSTGSSFDGSANNTNALTLATVNSNVGSFGSATQVPAYTVNAKGLITAASNTSIQIAESQVTNLPSDLALKAPLASPTFTGTVTVPTPSNSTDAATKSYVDSAVVGLLDYRGSYDASTNLFPATGGSGLLGAVLKGDFWICSVAGTLGSTAVAVGDLIIALVDAPGQTAANWDLIEHDLGYVPLNAASNLSDLTSSSTARSNLGLGTLATQSGTFSGTSSGTNTGDQTITLTGDTTGSGTGSFATTNTKMNGVAYSGLATGILKNTTTTGVPSIAIAADFPTLNQNTTGSAATLTTARTIGTLTGDVTSAGSTFNGSAANTNATVVGKINGVALSGLATGILKNTTTTGVPSIAAAGTDYVAPGGALGTPSSGTLTNATGLPIAGLVASTSTALGVGSIELGHATDTTLSRSSAGVLAVEGNVVLTSASSSNLLPTGSVVQTVTALTSAVATGTTLIPYDDTIPQNTEGDQYMSLAITPKSTTNVLIIEIGAYISNSGANQQLIAAIFQDSGANALAATNQYENVGTATHMVNLMYSMAAGTTSATTFKVRCGANNAGTTTFNGQSGARRFGGASQSYMKITEIKA